MCLVEVGWEGEITSVGTALHWVMPVFVPSWDLCTGRGWAATGWMPQARCQGSLQRAVVWWIRGQQALVKFLKSRWFLARQWQKSYWLKQIQIIGQGRKKACDRAGRETQISVITLIKKSVFLPFIIWSSSPSNTSPPPRSIWDSLFMIPIYLSSLNTCPFPRKIFYLWMIHIINCSYNKDLLGNRGR